MMKTLGERFDAKYVPEPNTGCWLWTGATDKTGYGRFQVGKKLRLAHRFSYEKFIGQIPEALVIDHLCRVRCCVNPSHLEPVSQKENVSRGLSIPSLRKRTGARVTHCKRGHDYAVFGARKSGGRFCSECSRNAVRRHRLREANKCRG